MGRFLDWLSGLFGGSSQGQVSPKYKVSTAMG
jgi:hypothetical protein